MQTSKQWLEYFQQNAVSLLEIPWDVGGDLTKAEKVAVTASIQGFQAGESSEGRNLFRYAESYAKQSGDHEYVAAIKLFIAEEQRHARDLARFLRQNDIPILKTTLLDQVFRKLRNLFGGLEISIAVLITAEIIAKVYYAALKHATSSRVLVILCDQILSDELKHVEFQAEQLGKLRYRRSKLLQSMTMLVQRFLYFGTTIVVWHFHQHAFRMGGYGFGLYWRSCGREFNDAFAISDGVIELIRQNENAIQTGANAA